MKIVKAFVLSVIFVMCMCSYVFAAGASLSGKSVKTESGKELSGTALVIKVNANEVEATKDKITVTLDGAVWNGYKEKGWLTHGITYQKLSDNQIGLIVDPTESMLKRGYSVEIPLNCKVTNTQSQIKAVVNWGLPEYVDREVVFATCNVTRAYLNGSIKEHKTGDKIYQKRSSAYYNKLQISVIGADAERTRNKITVTLDGATWSDYDDKGKVSSSVDVTYKKIDEKTIQIKLNEMPPTVVYNGYTASLPLTGTITGTGEIKAIVDYGVDDIEPSTVVFARCNDGTTVALESEAPDTAVDLRGQASSVTIVDGTTQGYKKNTKIELELNQIYHFTEVPKLECSEKFDGKCKIEINKDNDKKCTITFTDVIDSGTEGTIKIVSPTIERASSNIPKTDAIKLTMSLTGWEKYESTAQIAKYQQGTELYYPVIQVQAGVASANEYAILGRITVNDISTRSYKKGDKFEITFDDTFKLFRDGKPATVTGTGKFKDKCRFDYDESNGGKAYIVITESIGIGSTGTIMLNNVVLQKDTEETFEKVNMTIGLVGDSAERYVTTQIAKFSSIMTRVPATTTTTTTTEATTETTTDAIDVDSSENEAKTVVFKIGDQSYSVNGSQYELLAPPYIKDGYTMLPMRALANLVGITDDNISYENGTAEFILDGDNKLVVTVGENEIEVSGERLEVSTPAEIVNGTMFLPMRNLLNTLGVEDENISFNTDTKEVTIILK